MKKSFLDQILYVCSGHYLLDSLCAEFERHQPDSYECKISRYKQELAALDLLKGTLDADAYRRTKNKLEQEILNSELCQIDYRNRNDIKQ